MQTVVLMNVKYSLPPDKQIDRPKNLGEARAIITACFEENGWETDEQLRYLASVGVSGKTLSFLNVDELRAIIDDLSKAKMVLFKD